MARCTSPGWSTQLSWVLLGLQTSPTEELNMVPGELAYGEALVVSAKFFPSTNEDMSLEQLRRNEKPFTPVRRLSG